MLCKLLVGNPLLRPSAEDLLQHPWFQEHTILPTGPRLSNASNNSFNTQKKTTNKLRVTDPELEVSLHDLTRNLPQIRAFRERRLASHSLLVSSGVVTFLKVDRYANEKNYARLSDCSTLSGSTNRGEDSEEDQDSDEEEEVRRKQVDVEMKATMLPSRSARMKC